jgi:hypothetical protein
VCLSHEPSWSVHDRLHGCYRGDAFSIDSDWFIDCANHTGEDRVAKLPGWTSVASNEVVVADLSLGQSFVSGPSLSRRCCRYNFVDSSNYGTALACANIPTKTRKQRSV